MNLQTIREQRAGHVAEMRTMLAKAEGEKRSLSADEQAAFDTLKSKITDLESQEARAQFLLDAERRMMGTPAGGGDRSFADLERRVNVLDVLRAGMEGRALDGAAAEYSRETERRTGRKAQGVFVPLAALEQRVSTTTSVSDIVPTDHRPDQYISPLRNALLARRLGVRVLSGLSGNVSIPKHGSGLTVGWVAENSALTPSDMSFDSVMLSPRHAGGLTELSRQLIQQSSPDIERLVREDLAAMLAQAIDSALIKGGGANEPDGVLASVGTSGVQSGTLATPTWAQVLGMIEMAELENAPVSSWLTHPEVATKLRGTLKATGLPGYLLENGHMAERPVYVTNQVPATGSPATGTVILGDWSQAILGIWSEVDILVNPFAETAYTKGNVLVRAMSTVDVALRHPQAFVVADDVAI
ncbi:MAG: phage major capsid protein [Burkholderiales bacterium]|nr:phage major capsid protein [Burkholderiales bacterium]OJX08194.1 MAG: major capsid protein [Burkholderiales bacterium 70-64]